MTKKKPNTTPAGVAETNASRPWPKGPKVKHADTTGGQFRPSKSPFQTEDSRHYGE